MANTIYIRKIDEQCISHQISFTVDVHTNVFQNQTDFTVLGKRSGMTGAVQVLTKTDRRFGGEIKSVIRSELNGEDMKIGDILIFKKIAKGNYSIEIIREDDPEYIIFDDMCGEDRHTIISASKDGLKNSVEVYQLIKFGVPGTGKSFGITEKIRQTYEDYEDTGDSEFVFRTTLHPEYSYYDFVGSTFPVVDENKTIFYDFKPGIFTLALAKALNPDNSTKKIFLVLEEMSRANVAAVFGDLFQLLDRDETGESEYKIRNDLVAEYIKKTVGANLVNNNIYLPSNLFIYGTVNTSDQNVFVMDNAFKRRFEFEYVGTNPVPDTETTFRNEFEFTLETNTYKWTDFYQRFNIYVTKIMGLREDKQIGPFFVKFKSGKTNDVMEYNFNQIKNKLLQYMWEDVHKCAMAERPLFKEGIDSFGEAYTRLEKHENVFCSDFCDYIIVTDQAANINNQVLTIQDGDEQDEADN